MLNKKLHVFFVGFLSLIWNRSLFNTFHKCLIFAKKNSKTKEKIEFELELNKIFNLLKKNVTQEILEYYFF